MANNNPSIDPADNDTLVGAFRFILDKMLQNNNGMLPARVIAFDRTTNRVQVQPLIMVLTTDGSQVSRAQIASIPVMQLGGGGYMLSFNLVNGDLGWIQANDRDISLFLKSYSEEKPNTNRVNNFADSLFIPNIMRGYTIVGEDAEHATFQNLDGTVRVSLWPDKVKITAPLGLVVDGPVTASGLITGNGGITVNGSGVPFNVNGDMALTGDIAVTGNITATGDITPHV